MNPGDIIVYRGSIELGALPAKDALELLKAGFLRPTDCFREEPTVDLRTLAALGLESADKHPSFGKVKRVVSAVGQSASRVVDKLISATSLGGDVLGSAAGRLLEDYLPKIRDSVSAVLTKSTTSIDSAIRDDVFLTKLFGAAYDTLPKAVQRFVGEQQFIEFCMKHRSRLLRKPS